MKLDRKVKLMEKYNFSSSSLNFTESSFADYQSMVINNLDLLIDFKNQLEDDKRNDSLKDIVFAFGRMRSMYDTIDFEELDIELNNDEDRQDFKVLYETRDLLPQLGSAVNNFYRYCIENKFNINEYSNEIQALKNVIYQIGTVDRNDIRPSYERRLLELKEQIIQV